MNALERATAAAAKAGVRIAASSESNRASMPIVAAIVDDMRKYFPDCRVIFAAENGIVQGRRSHEGVTPVLREKSKGKDHFAGGSKKQRPERYAGGTDAE